MALTKIGSIGVSTGIQFAGVTTIATLNASDNVLSVGGTVNFVSDVSIGGTVSIAGTLTYEDVTNIDAVGLITARDGIEVTDKGVQVGTGATVDSAADNVLTFLTNGSERARINSSGLVGIGTDNPSTYKLHLQDSTSALARFERTGGAFAKVDIKAGTTAGNSYLTFSDPDASEVGEINYEHADDSLRFNTNSTEKLRITSGGDLIHSTLNKTLSLVSTQNVANAGTKIAFFGANRYDADEEFAAIRGLLVSNGGGAGNKQNGGLQFVVGNVSHTHAMTQGGYVGFGTGNPRNKLHVYTAGSGLGPGATYGQLVVENNNNSTVQILAPSTHESQIHFGDENNGMVGRIGYAHTDNTMRFTISNGEKVRINGDGRVLINSTVARNVGTNINRMLQIESSGGGAGLAVVRNQNTASGSSIDLGKSRGYPHTIVNNGDVLGQIRFAGADGTDLESSAAQITAEVDGTPGENDMPGRLIFSTTADGAAAPTERVRIDSDGDVTITGTGDPILTVTGSGHAQLTLISTSGTDHTGINFGDSDNNKAGMIQYTNSTNIMQFHADGAERARLLDTGRFLVGTTTSSQQGADGYIQAPVAGTSLGAWGSHAGSTGNRKHMRFSNPNGVVGSINTQSSGTSFNTSSDYRLKENQSPISNAISRINQLKPYTFNFKANPSEKIDGFFAHEAQELIPYAVEGEKDGEEMQSIDYGKLTPLLTAALQEAVAKIEVLESKVASLGG